MDNFTKAYLDIISESSNEPIKGSCRSMFTKPVVKGLFGNQIKK